MSSENKASSEEPQTIQCDTNTSSKKIDVTKNSIATEQDLDIDNKSVSNNKLETADLKDSLTNIASEHHASLNLEQNKILCHDIAIKKTTEKHFNDNPKYAKNLRVHKKTDTNTKLKKKQKLSVTDPNKLKNTDIPANHLPLQKDRFNFMDGILMGVFIGSVGATLLSGS